MTDKYGKKDYDYNEIINGYETEKELVTPENYLSLHKIWIYSIKNEKEDLTERINKIFEKTDFGPFFRGDED